MNSKITCFEDLIIWQKAQEIAEKIYKLAESNKFIQKDFSLKDQLRGAALSISDNIAEGFEYNNNPDFYRFLRMAKGSCGEIRNKIRFILRMKFIEVKEGSEMCNESKLLSSQIGELMKKVKTRITDEKARSTKLQGVQTRNP
ncbi:four helix bundle protein [Lacibacter sp.]|uniref:four helix bundle protein n=1 Tax=Lacibacter sp. TaxID=1915409 RepID=UPI002B4AC308|nr:four helix bundle protein [Lacibacter sp.]HLP38384.1 four helix bundle protein [Lacibacter sp.]